MESSPSASHHIAVSPLQLNFPLFEATYDDVVGNTELYETPTQLQSIVTPPTGFRTDTGVTQCGEAGDHGQETTPLTTTTDTRMGLGNECTELQCGPAIVPHSTPPLTEAPPTSSPSCTHTLTDSRPTVAPLPESALPGSDTSYKALYHGALERLRAQSTELAAFRRLAPLVTQLKTAKVGPSTAGLK